MITLILSIQSCDKGNSDTDVSPVANAGDDLIVTELSNVVITNIESDANSSEFSYLWSQVTGTAELELNDADTRAVSFIAPPYSQGKEYQLSLTVANESGETDTDFVTVMIVPFDVSENQDNFTKISFYTASYPPTPSGFDLPDTVSIQQVEILDDSNVIIAGTRSEWEDSAVAFKSVDSGDSWMPVFWHNHGAGTYLIGMRVVDQDIIYMLSFGNGSFSLLKSENGGTDWAWVLPAESQYRHPSIEHPDSFVFIDEHTGFVSNMRTINGGLNWTEMADLNQVTPIYFLGFGFALACSDEGAIFKSLDSGDTWQELAPTSSFPSCNSIFFQSATEGFLISENQLFKTIDGGLTWNLVYVASESHFLSDVKFLNDIGYLTIDTYLLDGKHIILKSYDAGGNWSQVYSSELMSFQAVGLSEDLVIFGGDDLDPCYEHELSCNTSMKNSYILKSVD